MALFRQVPWKDSRATGRALAFFFFSIYSCFYLFLAHGCHLELEPETEDKVGNTAMMPSRVRIDFYRFTLTH